MASMLENLSTIAPMIMAGFGKSPETSGRIAAIQDYNRQLADKEKLKAFGDELFRRGTLDKNTVFELGQKYDVDPISAMKLVMHVFETNRAMEGRTKEDAMYRYYQKKADEVGVVSPKDQSYIDLNRAKTGLVSKQADQVGMPKPLNDLDRERIQTERARRGLYGAQVGLVNARKANVGKIGTGRLVTGTDTNGNLGFFRDTGSGLVPVEGAKPKPNKEAAPRTISPDGALRALKEMEFEYDKQPGELTQLFIREMTKRQAGGDPHAAANAYDAVLEAVQGGAKDDAFLEKLNNALGGDN